MSAAGNGAASNGIGPWRLGTEKSRRTQRFELTIVFETPGGNRIRSEGPFPVEIPVPPGARTSPGITLGGRPAMWVDMEVGYGGESRQQRFPLELRVDGGTPKITLRYQLGATLTTEVELRSALRERYGVNDGKRAPDVTRHRYSTPREGEIVVCGERQVNW